MADRLQFRTRILASFSAGPNETTELLSYNKNVFAQLAAGFPEWPLPDEEFVGTWRQYAREAEDAGSILPLARYLVQLRFPVESGMSESADYLAAVRQGVFPQLPPSDSGIQLMAPERCRIVIHPTIAGHIPLLIAGEREDFVTLVRALTRRNEPVSIPQSMGAAMVAGFNNWHRIQLLREEYQQRGGESWEDEFQRIKPEKHLYQDRFIILSSGPYSGVSAADLHLPHADWLKLSLIIRREHECAHYFTRRIFSSMRNNLLDELIADYFGVKAAVGNFRADWLLRFFGLESFPLYREGGRLQNYRGKPPLSDAAFQVLQRLLRQAAMNVEAFDRNHVRGFQRPVIQTAVFMTLTAFTLEELASEIATELLAARLRDCLATLQPSDKPTRSQAAAGPQVTSFTNNIAQEKGRNMREREGT